MPRSAFKPRVVPLDDRITPALTFLAQQPFAVGARPTAVAVGDVNADGRPDIVTANGTNNTVTLFINNVPADSLAPSFSTSSFATGANAVAVVLADFNGDGRPDIATANAAGNSVSVLLNVPADGYIMPVFQTGWAFAAGGNPTALAAADFDGDGRPDLAVSSAAGVSVLVNATPSGAATPAFSANQVVVGFANRGSLAVADFNSDGRPDLAYSESHYVRFLGQYTNFVSVRANVSPAGAGAVTFRGSVSAYVEQFTASPRAYRLTTADMNADGQADLLLDGGTTVVQNTTTPLAADPTFGGVRAFAFAASPTGGGVAVDLDGDGRIDMAVPGSGNTASALTNTTPAFSSTLTFHVEGGVPVGPGPVAMAAGDFNADGRIDIVTANAGDSSISVLANVTATAVVTTPTVAGQFGGPTDGTGVWRMNSSTGNWDQLTAAKADVLATSPNGRVVGNFGANGVWYYNPVHGWCPINGHRANALAMDGLGNVYASFPGFGVAVYRLVGGWSAPLTGIHAQFLAVSPSGELATSFSGYGVYRYTHLDGWRLLTANGGATALVIAANGEVAVNFAGFGVYRHRPSVGWLQLNGYEATALAVGATGEVVANFAGYGLARYLPHANGWRTEAPPSAVTGAAVSVAVDLFDTFASFVGAGVWEHRPFAGWKLWTGGVAGLLAVAR